jgi:hypothetical protein
VGLKRISQILVSTQFELKASCLLDRQMCYHLSHSASSSGLILMSLMHFESIFNMVRDRNLVLFFCIQIPNFPSTVYWRVYSFSTVFFASLSKIRHRRCVALLGGFLDCVMHPALFLMFKLALVFEISYGSIQILELSFLALWRILSEFHINRSL